MALRVPLYAWRGCILLISFFMKKINGGNRSNCSHNVTRGRSFLNTRKLFLSGMLFSAGLFTKASAQVSLTATAGTAAQTYTTLSDAFSAINAGTHQGVINIAITGNTTEPAAPVALLKSSTPSSYTAVTIRPSGGNWTINSAASPTASRGVIELSGADNVTIDGDDPATAGARNLTILVATNTNTGTAAIRLSSNSSSGADGADNNTVKNCIITGGRSSATSTTVSYGINMSNYSATSMSTGAYSSLNTRIENNLITRCYHGIYANGASASYYNTGTVIKGNTIGSTIPAENIGVRGVFVSYSSGAANGAVLIEGNDIAAGDYATGVGTNVAGIELSSGNTSAIVRSNNIHDIANSSTGGWASHGIYISSSTSNNNISIYNNFIRDITATNYSTTLTTMYQNYGIYTSVAVTGLSIVHNTIVLNKANATNYGTANPVSACVNIAGSATLTQFLNNILINTQGGVSTAAYCFMTNVNTNISSATANNNNYYYTGSGKTGYYAGAAQATLANWQTATGKDILSISENIAFTSATDLHIPAGTFTLAESGGAPVATTAINTDIDGQTRPGASSYGFGTAPDMGADEFDGRVVYTCAQPAPGATLASANNICSGTGVTLSLANATAGTGVTYKWQSSPNNTTFTDISGAVSPTYTTVPTANLYYRCIVTCANGPLSGTSTPVQVVFANNITASTAGVRCGTGTVGLSASGNAGSTVKWYTALTGGASLGSGSAFTTPVISATTTYYAGAETLLPGAVTLGAGGTVGNSYDAIFYHLYGGAQSQFLIRASELNAIGLSAGDITSLGINMSTVTAATYAGFAISIGSTTNTDLSAGLFTGTLNPVYSAASYSPVNGVNTFAFTTPFTWDGTSNIVVKFCWSNNNTGGTSNYARVDNPGFVSCAYYRQDSQTPAVICSGTTFTGTTSNRPQFFLNGITVCSSPRVPVVATVNTAPAFTITGNQTACNNAVTTLTVTSNVSDYNNYTWTPATNLYTNAAATTPYTAGSSASTVYVRSATAGATAYTANAANTSTLCAAVAKDTVTILPATVTAVATPAYLCTSGITQLNLVPASGYGAAGYQWQSSANNSTFTDISGATGAAYTTPVSTSTTYYRAVIKNSAGASCLSSVSDTARIFNPAITGTTPGSRCGTGTVNLGAAGVDGIFNWYAAATGGTPLGSGASFTTPSISNTTTYYVAAEAYSPITATVGTATTTLGTSTGDNGLTPFSQYYEGAHSQYLLTAADLNASGIIAGNLTSLSFNVTAKNSTMPYAAYTVKLASATNANLSAGIATPAFTTVYGPTAYSTVVGANTFTFASPFAWDGVSNIIVDVCFSNDPGNTGILYTNNDVVSATTKTYTATYGLYQDNSALCGATTATSTTNSLIVPVMTFTEAGCMGPRVPVVATVNTPPVASVTPSGTTQICAGNSATLTATGGGTYQWRNASGNIPGQTNATFTTGTAGAYRVVVTTPATGCTDSSAAVTVNVNPLPTVFIGNDTTFCSGNLLTLNAANNGATFLWDNASTAQTRTVAATGTYYVKVTNSNNCVKSDTINVTVNPTPSVNLGGDTSLCQGTTLVLNAGNPGASRLWDNGTTGQTRTVTNSGTYYVRVTNSFNCTARDTMVASFLASPTVNLGADVEACAGTTVTLNAGNPGATYTWDNNSTQQTRNVTTSGTYYVTVRNIANCKGSDTVQVTIHPLPVVNLGNDTAICHDRSLTLNAGNPGSAYHWNDNSSAQTLVVDATGNYSVTVTDQHGCVNSDAINVLVKDLPSGIINAVHGDTATYTFNVLNPAYVTGYTWDFGDGSPRVQGSLVQHRYNTNGIYTVSVMLAGECEDSTAAGRTVDVYDAKGTTGIVRPSDSKELLLYPNPAKDLVTIENKGGLPLVHITVYNVIGQQVYSAAADSRDKHQLATARLAPGIYTLRIETGKGSVIRKFEIMK